MRQFPESLRKDFRILAKLRTPSRIQDFLDRLPINFEPEGDTLRSPREVLRMKKAHCIEGALLAAAALWYHGERPLLMDLRTTKEDFDHVVALFKRNGYWGALSKTNHAVLRYRDPIYRTPRELALSFFHEYFLNKNGEKTLRSYSAPFDLTRLKPDWLDREDDLWDVERALDKSPHSSLVSGKAGSLRRAHPIERAAGRLTQWKKK